MGLFGQVFRALARSSKLAALALALLGPKNGCALARDFGIFCARARAPARAHFRVRKSQNLPKLFSDIKIKINNHCKTLAFH